MAEDGEDDLKNATWDRLDAVLEASWRALGRDLGGLGAFLGSKVVSPGGGLTECACPVQDEVFEEEESEEVEGDPARLVPLTGAADSIASRIPPGRIESRAKLLASKRRSKTLNCPKMAKRGPSVCTEMP